MATKRDYYEILSVTKSASGVEIKKAYRTVAKKYHPDLNPGDATAEARFKECSEAYEVLSDEKKRQIYDQYGHAGLNQRGFQGFSNAEDVFSSFGDIFESFFGMGGGGRRSRGPRRGADLQVELAIAFHEAIFGCSKEVEIEREAICNSCSGEGSDPAHPPQTCAMCNGYGQVQQNRGIISIATTCPNCQGGGKVITHACGDCAGAGRVREAKTLTVEIPAGVENGMQVRMSGQGEYGSPGAPQGDLYVFLSVAPHEKFRREGEHVYRDLRIGIAQAALGTEVEVETLEDTQKIAIPKGSQPGDLIELKGQGVPQLRRKGRGNLYLQLDVQVPKRLSKKQQELLRAYAKESGERVAAEKKGFFS